MTADSGSPRLALRDDAVSWVPTDNGSVVVLDLRSSRYLNLNTSAAVLWHKVVEGASVDTMTAALVEEFGIDSGRASDDVAAFVADLQDRDLLVGTA